MTAATRSRARGNVLRTDLHGLALRIVCDDAPVLDAVRARLSHLPPSAQRRSAATIAYDLDREPHAPPPDGRIVYSSPGATAVYSPAEDALYAFHEDGATLRCAAGAGRAEIACSGAPEASLWVLTRPLLTLAIMELARRKGLYPLHAASLARDGAGVLVCGATGSGKSTLALSLLEAGLDFLGDDLVFVRETEGGVTAFGFPDELGIAAGTAALVPRLARELSIEAPEGWPKARVDVGTVAPTTAVVASCAPRLVLVLSEQTGAATVERLGPDAALLELIPSMLLTESRTCAAHLAALAALSSTTTCLRMSTQPDLDVATPLVVEALSAAQTRKDRDE